MARNNQTIFQSALRYMFANRAGLPFDNQAYHDYDNNKALTWSNAADTASVNALMVDSDNVIAVDHERKKGCRQQQSFQMNLNAGIANTTFFIADRPMAITSIEYVHGTAGTDAAAVTAQIFHDTGTQATGGGAAIMTNTFNCKGTINVVQNGTLLAVDGNGNVNAGLVMAAGDRLSIVFSGTTTALAGVAVTVGANPGFKEQCAVYTLATPATAGFFQANRDMVITGVNMLWGTPGSDAGAVTLDVTKDTGTTAPGAGSSILTAALSAKTAANTVNSPALSATVARLKLAAGDRLSLKTTGTLTALASVVVVVYMQSSSYVVGTSLPYYGQVDVPFSLATPASQCVFIADRDYEVVDASGIWSTAGTDGGTVTYDYEIAKGTTAVGSGTSISTGAVSVKTTANTTSVLPLSVSRRNRLMSQGDRLNLVMAGALTSLAGWDSTVSLLPR